MKYYKINVIITILFCKLFAVSWCDLPKEIEKCKSTDNDECIGRTMEKIFQLYPTGNPDFGMPNLSALNLTNLKVSKTNPDSPVQINFEFLTFTINGLEKSKMLRTIGFDKEMKNVEADVLLPNAKITGDYRMGGKILFLPINGKGKGEMDFRDVNMTFRLKMMKQKRNNKTYFQIKNFHVTIEPKLLIINLENLFNGNPELSKTLNEVINENWKDVWTEMAEGINQAMGTILTGVINDVFSNLSIEDMYAD